MFGRVRSVLRRQRIEQSIAEESRSLASHSSASAANTAIFNSFMEQQSEVRNATVYRNHSVLFTKQECLS